MAGALVGAWLVLVLIACGVGEVLFRRATGVLAFLDGVGPAAIGAIIGSAVPLGLALTESAGALGALVGPLGAGVPGG